MSIKIRFWLLYVGFMFIMCFELVLLSFNGYAISDNIVFDVSVPSDVKVSYVNREYTNWCGMYLLGGKIVINKRIGCKEYGFNRILEHELKHHEFFSMKPKQRVDICKSYNMSYNRECWEEYATR